MGIFVVNDLHGNASLIESTIKAIKKMAPGDILVINGDGAGARGPRMNKIIKIFYEVRRGETPYAELLEALREIIEEDPVFPIKWVFDSVHGGMFRKLMADRYEKFRICMEQELLNVLQETVQPISDAAKAHGVTVYYVPGNGEIVPSDFSTEDITVETALPPEERFYQKIAKEGFFEQYGIKYIPYAHKLGDDIALLSSNLLDLDSDAIKSFLNSSGLLDATLKTVIVHYPPTVSPLGATFNFWSPNTVDVKRTSQLSEILDMLKLKDANIIFGHIHLSPNDTRMAMYPPTMGFVNPKYTYIWVKPGAVIKL